MDFMPFLTDINGDLLKFDARFGTCQNVTLNCHQKSTVLVVKLTKKSRFLENRVFGSESRCDTRFKGEFFWAHVRTDGRRYHLSDEKSEIPMISGI